MGGTMLERDMARTNLVFVGGASGIGNAAAVEVARRGAAILLIGRSRAAGKRAASELVDAGAASADFVPADISTTAGVESAAAAVRSWKPTLHGLMHTAMSPFGRKEVTEDGLELAFALQYFARAALNRLLADHLAASGDGRIVHIGGNVPGFVKPDLDDLQFERRKWSFYPAVLGTHVLGYWHVQEAARRWASRGISATMCCVGPTRTKVMRDPSLPLSMRMMLPFASSPERSARAAVNVLTRQSAADFNGAIVRSPTRGVPEPMAFDRAKTARLWEITTVIARDRGMPLPE